ncbi:MAG: sulfite oxidase [Actinobacteria bacterium]|nr:sulfite oxidase [Actinomycetota bacterium]
MPLEALRYDVTPVGLHYLLIHFDIPVLDPEGWRLEVGGLVDRPLSLSLEDLRARPAVTVPVTMECAGNGRTALLPRAVSQPWGLEAVGTGRWTGTPLAPLLAEAGLRPEAVEVVFTGADRGMEGGIEQDYQRSLPVAEAGRDEVLLAHELNGRPLPPQHGFPVRLLVPGWYGMASVKWLRRIEAVGEPFQGYQQVRSYRLRRDADDPGRPLDRILPRALMVPPGIPDFATRERIVPPGTTRLEGRAWSGHGPIVRVEVSADGGVTWSDAQLGEPASPWAWTPWWLDWEPAGPGRHELRCRATDRAGNVQPEEAPWNWGGYANNGHQRVPVVVT